MLHLSMLGYNENWASLWQGLTHIVIDEIHTYRGSSAATWPGCCGGSPASAKDSGKAPVRPLLRHGGQPGQLAADLLNREVAVVTENGAPRGRRHFIFLDPAASAAYAASQLLEAALKRGLRTIVYTQAAR